MRGVLDDGDPQSIVISQVALFSHATSEALDLLNVVDLKDLILSRTFSLKQQRYQDSPLRVGVDAAACVAASEGSEEERCALRGLVAGRRA